MSQKKNKKILMILIIITAIVILIAGAAIVYLVTDIFKSDKELFFKYVTQVGDNKKGFISQNLQEYFEKRNNTPYNNESKISFNVPEEYYKNTEIMDNFNITLSGQVDKANSKASQNISINYSDSVNFPINYRQVENTIGVQTSYIGNKFISIGMNNLGNSLESQIPVSSYEDTIEKFEETANIELTEEQLNQIFNTYKGVLDNNLNDEDFSKVQDGNLEGYKLSLEGEKLKNILVQLLETLKNDELTLNKLNEYLKVQSNSSKIAVSDIDKLIKNIQNNSHLDDKKVEITAYKKSGSLSKILVSIDNNSVSIEKNTDGKNEGLKLSVIIDDIKLITLTADFEGLQSKQNVKENYEIELSLPKDNSKKDVVTYKYKLYNDINFTNESTIENFSSENSVMLTDLSDEQLMKFINTIADRISKVNKQQMEKLNLKEDENPLLYLNPIANIQNQVLKEMQVNIENSTESRLSDEEFLNGQQSEIEKLMQKYSWNNDALNAEAVETFNKKFELYKNTNLAGQTVKGLLSVISLNNENEDNYRIKEINFNGQEYDATETNIAFIKGDINLEKNYKVEFEKDENTGIIFRVIINEK